MRVFSFEASRTKTLQAIWPVEGLRMTKNVWPSDYPTDITVPPSSAVPISANLYRLVHKQCPNADDFLPSYKDPKQAHLIKRSNFKKNPRFYGASFFTQSDILERMLSESPERFDGQMIALGQITPMHGVGEENSHSKHVTMWFYDGVFPTGFEVI